MEIAIPLLALGSLYLASNQRKEEKESFTDKTQLPNVDIPDINYGNPPDTGSEVANMETAQTSILSTVNKYDTPHVYTDKYFSPNGVFAEKPVKGQYVSLTGDSVDAGYFQHNNMVPFFGGSVRTRFTDDTSNESVLDNMNGTGSLIYNKKEQAPLFSTQTNLQWAYGTPSTSDFVQSRMNVSQKMANVKPFEEIRVRPGLGKDGEQSYGFNSGMMARDMWMPKTVDQLRAANKPRASGFSMSGHEGPAMSHITNLGYQAPVEKNRPDRHFEMDPSRYFTTVAVGGHTLHGMPVDRTDPNRANTGTSYVGAAGGTQDATYVDGEYMPSKHMDLGAVPIAPASITGRSGAYDADYGMLTSIPYMNNRSSSNVDNYFGAVGGTMHAVVAPLLDVLRPSRRENTIGSMRPYQNPESTVKNSYLFNPNDRPAPTIREMTEIGTGHLFLNSGQNGDAYVVSQHTPAYTTRNETGNYFYSGIGGTQDAKQMRNYEAEYNQRNNEVRSSTIAGRMVPGNMSLMNNSINQRNNAMAEQDLFVTRASAPNMPYSVPSAELQGRVSGAIPLYSNSGLDRNTADYMTALRNNPYALSVVNAF